MSISENNNNTKDLPQQSGKAVSDTAGVSSTRQQEFRMPIHAYAHLSPEETTIVNHTAFQRLRRCRQLGLAHMVFPGAVHTRFEHSIGTVHVAQKIIRYVNNTYRDRHNIDSGLRKLESPVQHFIRLAALLHDIGHLPYGHTLEDELSHLSAHDGEVRLEMVLTFPAEEMKWEKGLKTKPVGPPYTMETLIDAFYQEDLDKLYEESELLPESAQRLTPFEVVKMIISKKPRDPQLGKAWNAREVRIPSALPLDVCRDMVGNTICADFLDYLHRDWHHIDRAITEDKRIYQYMEVRAPENSESQKDWEFVINAGSGEKRRRDAFTSVIDLLQSRYKLSETVIFHRSKLSLISLLDRCLIETRVLYKALDLKGDEPYWEDYFENELTDMLLKGSDDTLHQVLCRLAEGGRNDTTRKAVQDAIKRQRSQIASADRGEPTLPLDARVASGRDGDIDLNVKEQIGLIKQLATQLRDRHVYCEVANIDIVAAGQRTDKLEKNTEIFARISDWYQKPRDRGEFLALIEHVFGLPNGSVSMYIPPDGKMNAKVAKVKMYIDNKAQPLDEYEKNAQNPLTCGAVGVQRERFFHLWKMQFFVKQSVWDELDHSAQSRLAEAIKMLAYHKEDANASHIEDQIRGLIPETLRAARSGDDALGELPYILQGKERLSNGISTSFANGNQGDDEPK